MTATPESANNRIILRGGTVVSIDPSVGTFVGDILIDGDKIAALGDLNDITDAHVIDVQGQIVFPGFVDAHRHLYQTLLRGLALEWSLVEYCIAMFGTIGKEMTPDDLYLGTLLGAVDSIDAGVTGVFDLAHGQVTREHTSRSVDALRESGLRTIFGYGGSARHFVECLAPPFQSSTPVDAAELRDLRSKVLSDDDAVVTLGLFGRGPDLGTMQIVREETALCRELGIRHNIHVGQGIFPGRPAIEPMHAEGLLGPDVVVGHGNLLTDDEFKLMADSGVTVSVTPEDECGMGHGWPAIGRLMRAGIRPNVGVDTCMAAGGDMFSAMRFALAVTRGMDNDRQLQAGQNPMNLQISARDVLEFATIEGARALGLEDKIGSITVGKKADIVTMRTDDISMFPIVDPVASIVLNGSRASVDNVFVDGKRLKASGKLVGVDQDELRERSQRAINGLLDRCGVHYGWMPPTE